MVEMVALRKFPFLTAPPQGYTRLQPGQVFEVTDEQVASLEASGKARKAKPESKKTKSGGE